MPSDLQREIVNSDKLAEKGDNFSVVFLKVNMSDSFKVVYSIINNLVILTVIKLHVHIYWTAPMYVNETRLKI